MIKTLVQPFKYALQFMNIHSQEWVFHQIRVKGKANNYYIFNIYAHNSLF